MEAVTAETRQPLNSWLFKCFLPAEVVPRAKPPVLVRPPPRLLVPVLLPHIPAACQQVKNIHFAASCGQTSFVILRWIFFILLDSWHGDLCVKNKIISWNFAISTESNHRTILPPDASRQVLAVAVSRWLAHREPSVVLQLFLPAVPHVTWTGGSSRVAVTVW